MEVKPSALLDPYSLNLTHYTLTLEWKFSILFSTYFPQCHKGEFVWKSRAFFSCDHFLYSHDLTVWFRCDIVENVILSFLVSITHGSLCAFPLIALSNQVFYKNAQRSTAVYVKWSHCTTAHIMLIWRTALGFTPKMKRFAWFWLLLSHNVKT